MTAVVFAHSNTLSTPLMVFGTKEKAMEWLDSKGFDHTDEDGDPYYYTHQGVMLEVALERDATLVNLLFEAGGYRDVEHDFQVGSLGIRVVQDGEPFTYWDWQNLCD